MCFHRFLVIFHRARFRAHCRARFLCKIGTCSAVAAIFLTANALCSLVRKENPASRACGKKLSFLVRFFDRILKGKRCKIHPECDKNRMFFRTSILNGFGEGFGRPKSSILAFFSAKIAELVGSYRFLALGSGARGAPGERL